VFRKPELAKRIAFAGRLYEPDDECSSGNVEQAELHSRLRADNGRYVHWGLAELYGEETTDKMIAAVHSELYLEMLRTPISQLFVQLESSAAPAGCSRAQLAEQLYRARHSLTPEDQRGGAPEHMRSVLLVVELMSKYSSSEPKLTGGNQEESGR